MKLLIVDDSKAFRNRLRRYLAWAKDLEIAGEAENGAAALAALDTLKPDAILIDVDMTSGKGFDVLRQLKATGCPIPVIVMTNHSSTHIQERCFALGASFVMDKLEVSSRLTPVLAELSRGRAR